MSGTILRDLRPPERVYTRECTTQYCPYRVLTTLAEDAAHAYPECTLYLGPNQTKMYQSDVGALRDRHVDRQGLRLEITAAQLRLSTCSRIYIRCAVSYRSAPDFNLRSGDRREDPRPT